jgi:riboflavin synthase
MGRVRRIGPSNREFRIEIESDLDLSDVAIGASILTAGCCLTLVDKGDGWFAAEAIAETRGCTTLGGWQAGTRMNLERPLRLGGMLDGHIVTGHVDGIGEVLEVAPEDGSHRLRIAVAPPLHRLIAPKGSVALDGVSLTVAGTDGCAFEVCIIPHSWDVTTLSTLAAGSRVNIEVDILARYGARWSQTEPLAV